jgi:hypothetical protein
MEPALPRAFIDHAGVWVIFNKHIQPERIFERRGDAYFVDSQNIKVQYGDTFYLKFNLRALMCLKEYKEDHIFVTDRGSKFRVDISKILDSEHLLYLRTSFKYGNVIFPRKGLWDISYVMA